MKRQNFRTAIGHDKKKNGAQWRYQRSGEHWGRRSSLFRGSKKAEVEEDVAKEAPVSEKALPSSAKPPPPAPPSTFSSDRAEGEENGKDSKGSGSDSEGNSKGDESKWKSDNKGGNTLTRRSR